MTFIPVVGRLVQAPTVLTSGTSFAKRGETKTLVVELMGAGGGGGGAATAASSEAAGGGGGAGGYARKTFDVTTEDGPFTYAIGGGGAGGSTSGGDGDDGGDTTFTVDATTVTAAGGSGGAGSPASSTTETFFAGGDGGTATNGDLNTGGTPGQAGHRNPTQQSLSGAGGTTIYGGHGVSQTGGILDGADARGFGAGGGGGDVANGSAARTGGDGADGIIIVWEFS